MLLDYALLAVVLTAIAPYTLGPIIVRFFQRWTTRPAFEPYDPIRHPLPDDLAASFRESVDALVGAGYAPIADLAHASPIAKVQLRVALLNDPTVGGHALVIGARSTNPKAKIAACYVEFPTRFSDGTTLSVNNNADVEAYPAAPGRVVERFPQVRDPARLRRVNGALLDRQYADRPRVPLDPAGDPAGFVSDAMTREYELQIGTGYLWRDDRASPQVYRPTWLGAWAMAWRLLPPLRQILRARRRRRAAALLVELGLAGRDERPIAAPASADPLRWNLLVLVAAVLLYLLARR